MNNLVKFLEAQCDALDRAFKRMNIAARVTSGSVGPRQITYNITFESADDAARVVEMRDEIASAVGRDVTIRRLGTVAMVSIERDNTCPILLSRLLPRLRNIPAMSVFLGVAEHAQPILVHLQNTGHILITGPSGCGKSTLLKVIALSAWYFAPETRFVSPAPGDLMRLWRIRRHKRETWPPVLAMYDDVPGDTLDNLAGLAGSNKVGIFVVAATSGYSTRSTAAFPVRIIGGQRPGYFYCESAEWSGYFYAPLPDISPCK